MCLNFIKFKINEIKDNIKMNTLFRGYNKSFIDQDMKM